LGRFSSGPLHPWSRGVVSLPPQRSDLRALLASLRNSVQTRAGFLFRGPRVTDSRVVSHLHCAWAPVAEHDPHLHNGHDRDVRHHAKFMDQLAANRPASPDHKTLVSQTLRASRDRAKPLPPHTELRERKVWRGGGGRHGIPIPAAVQCRG
jgi:hypothetical protein